MARLDSRVRYSSYRRRPDYKRYFVHDPSGTGSGVKALSRLCSGPSVASVNRQAPDMEGLERGRERCDAAICEFDKRSSSIASRKRKGAGSGWRADLLHWPNNKAETVEQMNAHSCHAAGARLRGSIAPMIGGTRCRPIVAVSTFGVHEGAERATGQQFAKRF
jgi:hypothetical protein